MRTARSRAVLNAVETVFRLGAVGDRSDAQLVEWFVEAGDDPAVAEAAFGALVERHGPMVLAVCRRVLGCPHDAEDAYQAVFLVLARRARSLARTDRLAGWLHGVALRTARCARGRYRRRAAIETALVDDPVASCTRASDDDLRAVIDHEIRRLPPRWREPIVLCDLEGLTRREAALRLDLSEGTVSSRLARGRARLRSRLVRQGLAGSASLLGLSLGRDALASLVPPTGTARIAQAAVRFGACSPLSPGAFSPGAAALAQGVLTTMKLTQWKNVVAVAVLSFLSAGGIGLYAQSFPSGDEDRMARLEKKLDRLIDVLIGRRAEGVEPRLTPDAAPRLAVPSNVPLATTPHVVAASAAPSADVLKPLSGTVAFVPNDRIAALERRIEALEKRFDEFAKQNPAGLSGADVKPAVTPIPVTIPAR